MLGKVSKFLSSKKPFSMSARLVICMQTFISRFPRKREDFLWQTKPLRVFLVKVWNLKKLSSPKQNQIVRTCKTPINQFSTYSFTWCIITPARQWGKKDYGSVNDGRKEPSLNKKLQVHPIFLFPMGIKFWIYTAKWSLMMTFKSKTYGFYITF